MQQLSVIGLNIGMVRINIGIPSHLPLTAAGNKLINEKSIFLITNKLLRCYTFIIVAQRAEDFHFIHSNLTNKST